MAINVTLANSMSDDPILNTQTPDGTTYRQFLEFNKVSLSGMVLTARIDGERIDFALDDEMEDGVKLTVTPEQIKGA